MSKGATTTTEAIPRTALPRLAVKKSTIQTTSLIILQLTSDFFFCAFVLTLTQKLAFVSFGFYKETKCKLAQDLYLHFELNFSMTIYFKLFRCYLDLFNDNYELRTSIARQRGAVINYGDIFNIKIYIFSSIFTSFLGVFHRLF